MNIVSPARTPRHGNARRLCRIAFIAAAAVGAAAGGPALADAKFSHLSVRFEHNATDRDFEVVFEAKGGETGLSALQIAAPDGRIVVDFKAPNSTLGVRTFRLESPEPKALAGLQADFPAGKYTFTASTVAGSALSGSATLSHKLPAPANLVRPKPDEQGVPIRGLQVQWRAAKDLASCLVTIEDDAGVKIVQAALPGSATVFPVPDRVLAPGVKYSVSIGTVGHDGNASFVEASFQTADRR